MTNQVKNGKLESGYFYLFFYLIVWFFIGGFFSWGPLISYGVNPTPIHITIVVWIFLMITGGHFYVTQFKKSKKLFLFNFGVWICLISWVYYDLGW